MLRKKAMTFLFLFCFTSSSVWAQNPHQQPPQGSPQKPPALSDQAPTPSALAPLQTRGGIVEPRQEGGLSLFELERIATQNNPTLKQAEANVQAARGRVRQAGLYPNPTVGYTGDEISPGPIIRGGEHGFFVDQRIVLGGKLGKNRQVFSHELAQAEAELQAQRLRVTNSVRQFYYQALAAQRRIEIRRCLAQLADEVVQTSHGLYNVGQSDRPDVLESEIEAQQLRLGFDVARHEYGRIWRQLTAILGDPGMSSVPLAGTLDDVPALDENAALREILRASPELLIVQAGVERGRAAVSAARAARIPDLEVRGGLRYNRELLELGLKPVGWEGFADVGIQLPIFNRNQGNIVAAVGELSSAEQEIRRLELSLRARFGEAFAQYASARQIAESYKRDLLPRAEEAHQLYLARFGEMTAAYPQVLIARRSLLRLNEQYVSALESVWEAVVPIQGFLLGDGFGAPVSFFEPGRAERGVELKGLEVGKVPEPE